MTAACTADFSGGSANLRRVDPRRDMVPIANVIEAAFAGDLGEDGRRMVREMRAFGRVGWIGWLIGKLFLPPAANPQGYVWEEDGQVVGNASLLGVGGYPYRWILANVAVLPEFQNRGIGGELVRASIGLARKLGGRELFLQVKAKNDNAIRLYERLGFDTLSTRTTWLRRRFLPKPNKPGSSQARPRKSQEWRAQWALAREVHPEGLEWPYPLRKDQFQPRWLEGILGWDSRRHWVWMKGSTLLASLSSRSGFGRSRARFVLVTDPRVRGDVEQELISLALIDLGWDGSVLMDYPIGAADGGLSELGFIPRRTLTWMARSLTA